MKTLKEKKQTLFFIYLITFLTTISFSFIAYINSSFLKKFIDEEYLGIIYGLGSAVSLVLLTYTPRVLKKIGHYKMMLGVLSVEALSIATISILDKKAFLFILDEEKKIYLPLLVILAFLVFSASVILLRLSLDLYLEKFSKDQSTGESRGIFLTVLNVAIALSPYLVGKILSNGDYYKVYTVSALIFIPVMFLSLFKLKKVPENEYHDEKLKEDFKKIWENNDLRSIFVCNFLLEFFYCWMVIYMPIYLNSVMGFVWEDIGLMFSIALLPFIFIQFPLGKIADLYIGEKEILTSGFILSGLSTIYLSFILNPDFVVWTIALFLGRTGIAAIEVMNETYLFKNISAEDSDIMAFFRKTGPIAYIIGPGVASLFLYFLDFRYIFILLGVVMISGIKFSLAITDTK